MLLLNSITPLLGIKIMKHKNYLSSNKHSPLLCAWMFIGACKNDFFLPVAMHKVECMQCLKPIIDITLKQTREFVLILDDISKVQVIRRHSKIKLTDSNRKPNKYNNTCCSFDDLSYLLRIRGKDIFIDANNSSKRNNHLRNTSRAKYVF